jgi:asparagine synthase (glutamine-hydrolysing)
MCGIAALLGPPGLNLQAPIQAMAETLHHRGPDARGTWTGDGVALGHARLSILELSPAGAQPMASRDGRWSVAFNGEIYNHLDLRADLAGPWRGHSDTETLVAGFAAWGVEATLQRCVGMFAIAAWDGLQRSLWLARDRLGEKPLHYGVVGGVFRAASELKAVLADGHRPEVDRDSLTLLLRHNYIPAPYTIWQGIAKLRPGHLLEVRQDAWDQPLASRPYWSVDDLTAQAPFAGSDAEAVERLDALLRASIRGQMMADVPLGAFLSGGIDSSAVVALMQAQSPRPIRTFTIGFNEKDFDESTYAADVAAHLGTDHTTMHVTAAEAQAAIADLPGIWDEPFADSSQIPTLLLSRLTRRHVTVSLSGDGGDELFAGYHRHFLFERMRRLQARVPLWLRRAAVGGITAIPPAGWDLAATPLRWWKPVGTKAVGDKAHKLAGILDAQTPDHLYQRMVTHWPDPSALVIGGREPSTVLTDGRAARVGDPLARIQYLDQLSYLPDDILVKVDRAAMAASLETRVPFLDHRLVDFAWGLPKRLKVRDGQGKWILRQVLDRYVPRHLIDRPKMGFGVPLAAWLRGPLRPWAEDLLGEERLRREGFFHPGPIRLKWTEHLSGRRNWQYHLWDILMFQAWWAHWRGPATVGKSL